MDEKSIKTCSGCGVKLQDENVLQEGYTTSLDNDICQRCFRMKNYGEYKMILVLNKRDVLPKSVNENILIKYLEEKDIHFEEVIVVSVSKNYNIDYLLKKIKFHQTSKNVYVVGHTNAGKSSLINKLIQNYSDNLQELTMSPLPSTTLNTVKIEINEHLTLIDTPGLVDSGSILNHVDTILVKKEKTSAA